MSQAFKCDICQNFYTINDFGLPIDNPWRAVSIKVNTLSDRELNFDLCPKCSKMIEETIKKRKIRNKMERIIERRIKWKELM